MRNAESALQDTVVAERPESVGDASLRRTLAFLGELFGGMRPRPFDVRLWDGTVWRGDYAAFTLVVRNPGALRSMFTPPGDLALGEAYIFDDYDIEGDINAMFALLDHVEPILADKTRLAKLGAMLLTLPKPDGRGQQRAAQLGGRTHTKKRDAEAIRYHYDVGNDFYRLWLDDAMVYSCAYFAEDGCSLDDAQQRKLDYLCRKLRLAPGDRLLDIGSGWGGLGVEAAKRGATVLGVTLSPSQAELANERASLAGVADRCRFEVRDYREVDEREPFDKLVSVGMFEHVGSGQLPGYFDKAVRLLRPGGAFLNHGISVDALRAPARQPTFSQRYVFPDGELLPIGRTLAMAEDAGFEVRDVENLREHYALTLREWVRRLEERHAEAVAAADETTYRIWRMFMSASAHGFETGLIGVHQSLLVKTERGRAGVPLTREDWYT